MAFVTERAGTVIDANDRLVRVFVTRCTGCGAAVKDKAERIAHRCPQERGPTG